jgi:RHS repeat-associated protein
VLVTGGSSGDYATSLTGAAVYQVTFVKALGGQPQPEITIFDNTLVDESNHFVPTFTAVTTPGVQAGDEVQQVEVLQPSGTFTLSLSGATVAVAVGSSDAQLAADLASLPLIGSTANVSVSGSGTAADPYEVTFIGSLAGESVPQLSVVGSTAENTIHTTYNADGSIASIGDNYSDYSYTYDGQGNAKSVDNSGSPNMPHVVLTSVFDAAGNRQSLAATINGTADFVNGYSYDELSRLIDITQQQQTGGNAVATKQVYYTLDPLGDVTGIYRSNNPTLGEQTTGPAYSTLTYNPEGLLTGIIHYHQSTALESMAWTYDALDRASTFSSNDGTATYGYDSVNEVTSAIYSTASGGHQPANESYNFDNNGNRTTVNGVTTSVSVNNEVTNDGTFTYTFDADGNRLTRERDVLSPPKPDDLVSYTWDARNRLTGVEDFSWNAATTSFVETESIAYTYDVFDHLIERVDDLIGTGTTTTQYVWDLLSPLPPGEGHGEGGIILAFTNGTLSNRYLNGPNTNAYDQYFSTLAEENVGAGTTTWDLLDNQSSVRDVIDSNGVVLDHLSYNSFGQVAYESAPSVSHIDGYTGGLYDRSTQLVYFIHRWYDPTATVWISADPSGFAAGDTNLTRYALNSGANLTDPSGLEPPGTLRLGGDPKSPFTLPVSDRVRAEQWLFNTGLSVPRGGQPPHVFTPPSKIPASAEVDEPFIDWARRNRLSPEATDTIYRGGCHILALWDLGLIAPTKRSPGLKAQAGLGWGTPWVAPGAIVFAREYDALAFAATVPGSKVFAYQNTARPLNASTPGFKPIARGQIDPAPIANNEIMCGEKNVAVYHVGPRGAYWQWMNHSRGNIKQRRNLPAGSGGNTNLPFVTTVYVVLTVAPPGGWAR